MKAIRRLFTRSESGSAVVEFSLIAFTFVMLLLAVLEMSRMLLVYNTVANAAPAGARYAIVHGGLRSGSTTTTSDISAIQQTVRNFASPGLLDTSQLTINVVYPDATINVPGSHVYVTVTYPFAPLISFFTPLLSRTLGSTSEGIIVY